jgi:signal peptidase II
MALRWSWVQVPHSPLLYYILILYILTLLNCKIIMNIFCKAKNKFLLQIFSLSILIIIVDQLIKIMVHCNMALGSEGRIKIIGEFFKLHYTLNPGMAFGLKFSMKYGKFALTLGRIVASFGIIIHIIKTYNLDNSKKWYLFGWALILGGAIGNVIDSTFYGVIFDNAPEGSITPWFHGQVIDMFYFDVWETVLPNWVPLFGNLYLNFFPIFNFADVSIVIGVCVLLLDNRRENLQLKQTKMHENATQTD